MSAMDLRKFLNAALSEKESKMDIRIKGPKVPLKFEILSCMAC